MDKRHIPCEGCIYRMELEGGWWACVHEKMNEPDAILPHLFECWDPYEYGENCSLREEDAPNQG